MPAISIVVPIYNVEFYLSECLESILKQTFNDFELILVNDGSTDGSGIICDRYENKDKRVKVIHQVNKGVSSARNKGINASAGEYIAFVDPDDTVEPTMYEILYTEAISNNLDLVVCPIKTMNSFTNTNSVSSIYEGKEGVLFQKDIKSEIIPSFLNNKTLSLVSSVNKLYKSSLFNLNKIRYEEHKNHSEDLSLNLKILPYVKKMIYVKKPLYNYYIRRNNSLTQTFREDLYSYIEENRRLMLDTCYKYSKYNFIKTVRGHYAGVTLNFLQELIVSPLNFNKKRILVKMIVNDKEFLEDVKYYNAKSLFTKLLVSICKFKSDLMIIRVIQLKLKFQNSVFSFLKKA
ncbi:glycosyltransferase [Halobacillus sp. B29]|uniref:glycosyltransferase n=1 Tax=Halobacillus sp. B29 TaxID=3457432 RepID=UPI003FCE3EF0